jgi:hypothetical protein
MKELRMQRRSTGKDGETWRNRLSLEAQNWVPSEGVFSGVSYSDIFKIIVYIFWRRILASGMWSKSATSPISRLCEAWTLPRNRPKSEVDLASAKVSLTIR